jgi:hypothetical protein
MHKDCQSPPDTEKPGKPFVINEMPDGSKLDEIRGITPRWWFLSALGSFQPVAQFGKAVM